MTAYRPNCRRIPELNGLRVLLVFIVSWYHFWQQSWLSPWVGRYWLGYLLGAAFQAYITAVDHWVAFVLLAFIGGMFIEKSKGNPVVSAVGLVLGDAACYVLGTAWFVFQMQCELGYALTVCVYPFIALDLAKIVVSCIVGALLRKRLTQAGVLKLQNAVSE